MTATKPGTRLRGNRTGRRHRERMADRGADEQMSSAEWILRNNPGALAAVRSRYRRFCEYVVRIIERES